MIHIDGTILDATLPIRLIPPIITNPTQNAKMRPVSAEGIPK